VRVAHSCVPARKPRPSRKPGDTFFGLLHMPTRTTSGRLGGTRVFTPDPLRWTSGTLWAVMRFGRRSAAGITLPSCRVQRPQWLLLQLDSLAWEKLFGNYERMCSVSHDFRGRFHERVLMFRCGWVRDDPRHVKDDVEYTPDFPPLQRPERGRLRAGTCTNMNRTASSVLSVVPSIY
jgi:hypothetical protein